MPALVRDRYLRRRDVVENMIQERKLAFTVRPFGKTHADYVRFDDFARMALRLNWIMPARFPGRPERPPVWALRAKTQGPGRAASLVANTMRLVRSLTKKNPATVKRAVGLGRQALAVQIDAAVGWEPRADGTPSAEAVALARAILAAERANVRSLQPSVPKEGKPRSRPRRRTRRSARA